MKFVKDPDKRYRAAPFWSLNGKLDKTELLSQIRILKDMGFGGAFIHSRTGLVTEYMGDEWMELVRACADECERQDMDAWLYDEDRWPSGTCGGYVTEDPRYRLSFISAHIYRRGEYDAGRFGAGFLGAFAVKLGGEEFSVYPENMPKYSGMEMYDYFPVHNGFEIPEGYICMAFCIEQMEREEFYNDFTYADTMSMEATRRFIELTHEKYRGAMGEKFGNSIKGIFTDEPHRGALLNGFGIKNARALYMLPYTEKLFCAYSRRWGEDLKEKLPELYFKSGDNFSRAMWRYVETLQTLFLDNFAKPIHSWCKSAGLVLTGHVLHEDTLSAQTTMSGSVMRYYEHMQYPGLDNLGSESTCFPAAIAVSSVAKQTGKKFVLSELYGCTGWKTTFMQYKRIGDWQAALGVNLRCPHLSWYTMKGEAKRDYPASIGRQAVWRREYRAVEDYFARLGCALDKAKPTTDTLVITPVESAWGLSRLGTYVNCFGVRDPEYMRLEEVFARVTENLVYAGIDFDYGDEEMMGRLSKVGKDELGAYITVGKMKYRKVVMPAMINTRCSTVKLLRGFIAEGGKVVAAEYLPRCVDGDVCDCCINARVVRTEDIVKAVGADRAVKVESDGKFFGTLKSSGDEYVFFTVNAGYENKKARIVMRGEYNVEKFDLRSGDVKGIKFAREGGNTVVEYEFAGGEELLLHFTRKKVAESRADDAIELKQVEYDKVKYRLGSPNVLVLDRAKCYIDGEYFGEDELLRLDRKLRDRFGLRYRGGCMVQPWYKRKFFGDAPALCRLKLEFEFDSDVIPADAEIMLEDADKTTLSLNGVTIDGEKRRCDIDECFSAVNIPAKAFKTGRNVLCAEFDFGDYADIENMYILGGFGVRAGQVCRITQLPEFIRFGDVTTQGFPFYAGDLTYLCPCGDGEYAAEVPEYYAACLKSDGEVCAFAPNKLRVKSVNGYAEITAVLTPKNMFGPLHEVPAVQTHCGPDNYHTGGAAWSDGFALIPQGILQPVKTAKIK